MHCYALMPTYINRLRHLYPLIGKVSLVVARRQRGILGRFVSLDLVHTLMRHCDCCCIATGLYVVTARHGVACIVHCTMKDMLLKRKRKGILLVMGQRYP